jgi:hypothetical protein
MGAMGRVAKGFAVGWIFFPVAVAQHPETTLSRLRELHLAESAGSVTVIYVPSAKQRAIEYRQTMQDAVAWFERELDVQAPIVLAVVDRETYSLLGGNWPHPYSDLESIPAVVVFPSQIEEVLGPEARASVPGEYITYHEAGHIFANLLKIWSGNAFVNEVIANMFEAAYIQRRRLDLGWVLEGPPARFASDPRYTSLADLDYLYTGVGFDNMAWFQYQLQRVAKHLVKDRPFSSVVELLKAEFPTTQQKQEPLDRIILHFDAIQPGTKAVMGKLAGPGTLASLQPRDCQASTARRVQSFIVVRNNGHRQLTVEQPGGAKSTVPPQSWRSYQLDSGASLKLSDGSCFVAGDEPGLATIGGQ